MSSVEQPDSPDPAAAGGGHDAELQEPALGAEPSSGAAAVGTQPAALEAGERWRLRLRVPADADAAQAAATCAALVVPSICVCCGEASSQARQLELSASPQAAGSRPSLLVPLCDRCFAHEAEERTRALSLALAALLLGTSLAFGLPLAVERLAEGGARQLAAGSWLSRYGLFLVPCGVMLGLVAARWLLYLWTQRRRRRGPSGCVAEPALVWQRAARVPASPKQEDWFLSCGNARFAAALLAANPAQLSYDTQVAATDAARGAGSGGLPQPELRWLLAVFCALGVMSATSFWIHRPVVQILNLSGTPLVLEVDGETLGSIRPTSQESPSAGLTLRLPAGRRHVRALSGETVVAEADVTLLSGAKHLYAPASDGHCFWLERLGYGRGNLQPEPMSAAPASSAQAARIERVPLSSPLRFWAFDHALDVWLAPPPEPLLLDLRSSGGEVVALRQARCVDAPADARPR